MATPMATSSTTVSSVEHVEVAEPVCPPDSANRGMDRPSPLNASDLRERRQRKKLRFKKLEKKLEVLDRQIKKCAEAELNLDEMESGYSAYIKEDILKRKFVKTWQELCQLQRVNDSIVIDHPDGSNYEGTPYPEVNRRVKRLLRLDEFPDYIDIVQLLDRCNTKYSLGIAAEEKGQLARKVFKEVGKIMKTNRRRDFLHHFGSHLTDGFTAGDDPAEKDEDLLKELQKSLKDGEKKMEAIVEEFVLKQEQEYGTQGAAEGDSCSADEREEEEEEDEEEKDDEELINVVDGSDSEVESGTNPAEDAIKEEEETISLPQPAGSTEIIPDSTTIHMESSDNVVTSTHSKESGVGDQPGPSGLAYTNVSHISSSSEIVCIDDDDDDDVMIVISDSEYSEPG